MISGHSTIIEEVNTPVCKQRIQYDLLIIIASLLLLYSFANYFNLTELFVSSAALSQQFILSLLLICSGLFWFCLRRLKDLKLLARHNDEKDKKQRDIESCNSKLQENNHLLTKRIAQVRESERQRLAIDLHNIFGQHLAAIDANLTVALSLSTDTKIIAPLSAVMDSATHLRMITRDKLKYLKSPALSNISLSTAIHELLDDWHRSLPNISMSITVAITDTALDDDTALTLYRALQEGLINIAHHAHANHVEISLTEDTGKFHLSIQDNGQGFSPENSSKGLGILSIRERTEALNGKVSIKSLVSGGTSLKITIPKQLCV